MAKTDTDFAARKATYDGFVRLAVAAIVVTAIGLFALVAMTVIGGLAFWVGAVGVIAGHVVVAVTLALRLSWTPSLAVLAAMVVLTVVTL